VIFAQQNLISNVLTYLVHAKSTSECRLTQDSATAQCILWSQLVQSKFRLSNDLIPNKKWLHFLADLRSVRVGVRIQQLSAKDYAKKRYDPMLIDHIYMLGW